MGARVLGWLEIDVLTIDTSAIYAILLREDPDHQQMLAARDSDPGPYFIPAAILAEVGYMLQRRPRLTALDNLLVDLASRSYRLDCGEDDFPRIRDLVHKYSDLDLSFSDAAVVACAERHGGRTLTCDRRHFDVVARGEKTITVIP